MYLFGPSGVVVVAWPPGVNLYPSSLRLCPLLPLSLSSRLSSVAYVWACVWGLAAPWGVCARVLAWLPVCLVLSLASSRVVCGLSLLFLFVFFRVVSRGVRLARCVVSVSLFPSVFLSPCPVLRLHRLPIGTLENFALTHTTQGN